MKRHVPVLLNEVLSFLPKHARNVCDGTLGHGGHTQAMLQTLRDSNDPRYPHIKIYGMDIDKEIMEKAKVFLSEFSDKVDFNLKSYTQLDEICKDHKILFDFVLIDLGINREHVVNPERGFSIKKSGPLDMRFSSDTKLTAKIILETYTPDQLKKMFIDFADVSESFTKRLIRGVMDARKKKCLDTTEHFIEEAGKQVGTSDKLWAKLFQALRIEVNGELQNVQKFLEKIPHCLAPGGVCAIISYHSGEDRIVKQICKQWQQDGTLNILTKHVIKPTYQEVLHNRAARSAKLRIIESLAN